MTKLFCDLKTDEEKSAFFLSGRGYETGVIAASIQNDVAMAYHRCAECAKELAAIELDRQGRGEPAAWQFYDGGRWWNGDDRIKDHRKNTEAAGYQVRDLYAAPQPAEPVKVPSDESLRLVSVIADKIEDGTLFQAGIFSRREMADKVRDVLKAARFGQPAQSPSYKDSTPHLHIGDSSFEAWFADYNPASMGDKQRARDAYAAGMGDPLVGYAQPVASAEPVGEVYRHGMGRDESGPREGVRMLAAGKNLPHGTKLFTASVAAQPSVPERNEIIELLATLLHFIPKDEPEIYRDTERLCGKLRDITPPTDGQAQQENPQ